MKTVFVGGGKGCLAVLELVHAGELRSLSLEVLAVMDIEPNAPAMRFAREHGWRTLTDIEEALALPDLDFVIELTGSDAVLDQIYHHLPAGVRVMDHETASVFWDLDKVTLDLRQQLRDRTEMEARLADDRAELREILDTIPDVVMVVDCEMRVLRVNRRFEELTGISRGDIVGMAGTDAIESLPRGIGCHAFAELFDEVLESGEAMTRLRRQHISGKERFFQVTGAPTVDDEGHISRVVLTSRDTTEQVKLKRELARSERLMAVGKLAAGVAHELNNPLTGILVFAEDLLLEADESDPKRPDYEVILNEAMRCRRIVRDLLDFSRQKAPERARVHLNDVIRRSLTMVERQASFLNVTFELELGQALPAVDVDQRQISQAILNLVINARDAVSGRGTITLRSESGARGRTVVLSISDDGCGIEPEKLKEIFEPFYSTKGDQGNGLGLPAVMSVVEQHGGHVEVESEVGVGSEFRLVLPAVRDQGRQRA